MNIHFRKAGKPTQNVTVHTPAEITQSVISDVVAFDLPGGTENSLISRLESAITSFIPAYSNRSQPSFLMPRFD